MTRIVFRDVTVANRLRCPGEHVLEGASIAVIGENGSGKSTLARVVAGLVDASGSVTVDGISVRETRALRRHVGVVFTNPAAQVIMPTVREDVALTFKGHGVPRAEIDDRVDAALAAHGLTELAERSVHELSGGQQQRLALCSVLAAAPRLIVADEPTTLLDARHRRMVADRLLATGSASHSLLLVTHDLDLAARCEQAVLVSEGRISAVGTPREVIDRYLASLT